MLILIANAIDIQINPGPNADSSQYQCGTYDETVDWEQKGIVAISGIMPNARMSILSVMKPSMPQIIVGIVSYVIRQTIAAQCTIYTPQ